MQAATVSRYPPPLHKKPLTMFHGLVPNQYNCHRLRITRKQYWEDRTTGWWREWGQFALQRRTTAIKVTQYTHDTQPMSYEFQGRE